MLLLPCYMTCCMKLGLEQISITSPPFIWSFEFILVRLVKSFFKKKLVPVKVTRLIGFELFFIPSGRKHLKDKIKRKWANIGLTFGETSDLSIYCVCINLHYVSKTRNYILNCYNLLLRFYI